MIEFNQAVFSSLELEYLHHAVNSGHVSGNGPMTKRAEQVLSDGHQGARCLLTTSCTHALEMSALLCDLEPGAEVIVPAYTFVTTASSFLLHGATPVFVDVDPVTLNLDLEAARAAITERTRAICTVHYAGVGSRPEELAALCDEHDLVLVEDNAHGLFGTWNGRRLGTFGALSTLSFHETKNLNCGEGGALVCNDATLVERAEILREKGTNRAKFFRGQVDKYTWVDVGSSWVLSDLLAGLLLGQLERVDEIQRQRQRVWSTYDQQLAQWSEEHGVRTPWIPPEATHTAHMFHLRLATLDDRTRLIDHLRQHEVKAVFHYQPLHLSEVGRRLGGRPGQHPVTEDAADTLVRLPLHAAMTPEDTEKVVAAVRSFRPEDS